MPVTIDGSNTATPGGVAYGNTDNELDFSVAGSAGQVLVSNGSSPPGWGTVPLATGVSGTLPVGNGGTGATTLTGILKGNGASAFSAAVSGTDIKTVNSTSLLGSGNVSVGTVTSVGGTGSANGLSLSGTVSSTGNLTLSGTSYTANNVLLGNGTSAFQSVAPGSSGNILTSNGTTWTSAAPAGGATWVYINGVNLSGGTSGTLSSVFSGTYLMYMIVGQNMRHGGGAGEGAFARVITGSGTETTNYRLNQLYTTSSGTTVSNENGDTDRFWINRFNLTAQPAVLNFVAYLGSPSDTASYTTWNVQSVSSPNATQSNYQWGGAVWVSSAAVTGIQIFSTSPAFTSGRVMVYGLKSS